MTKKERGAKMWENPLAEAKDDLGKRSKIPCHNLAKAAVQIQLGRLWGHMSQEVLENIASQFRTEKAVECDFKQFLVQYGYVAVRDEKEWEIVAEVAPYAPLLTAKQGKLLSLVALLSSSGTGSQPESTHHHSTLVDDFIAFIRCRLFADECYFSYKKCQLANVSRFFMALVRFKGDEVAAKAFILDTFYHRSNRNFVMLTVFFDTWPEIMFWTGTSTTELNPLLETVIWSIYNTGPPNSLAEMKVFEARHKLEKTCGLPQPKGVTNVDLVKLFIDTTERKFDNQEWTDSTKLSLLFLARVNEYQWANNNIVRRLLEVFAKYMQGHDHNVRGKCSKMLAWVVDTVGLVARVYPVEPARNNLKSIFDSFAKLLQHESAGLMTPELEDACLRALVHTGHHLPVQFTKFLNEWRGPQFPSQLSNKTLKLVENFVGTKAYTQSAMTVQVAKKQKVFDHLNR